MATKKRTSTSAIDRQIAATRKKIAAVNKKKREEKALKKKQATLAKLKTQAKRIGATRPTKRRR